jgi:molybdopterin-guanine dinucleotide biosynthesis protein A
MMTPGPFGIIILAGGRGSRLGGQDKPGLVVGGDTLLASVARAGTGAGAAQIVVVGPERPGLDGVSFVREEPPGGGPVPALRRGLAEASAPWVAVLAADLPFLRAGQLKALRAAAEGGPGAILVDDTGRPQWLAGCWATETLRRAVAGYHQDSLHGLLGPLAPVLVRLTPPPGEPPPWLDCDTPEDLRRARDLADPQLPGWPGPDTRTTITRSDRNWAVAQRQGLALGAEAANC